MQDTPPRQAAYALMDTIDAYGSVPECWTLTCGIGSFGRSRSRDRTGPSCKMTNATCMRLNTVDHHESGPQVAHVRKARSGT